MDLNEWFWKVPAEDLKAGSFWIPEEKKWICLVCGRVYEEGKVYEVEGDLYLAEKAIDLHIRCDHGGTWNFLLELDQRFSVLSETQTVLLTFLHDGKSNRDIAQEMKVSESTVRNHRFRLREKAKQARIFLALWELVEVLEKREDKLVEYPKTATMIDDRYSVTEEEAQKMIEKYVDRNGKIIVFPNKQKSKWIILRHIIKEHLKKGIKYEESEINRILMNVIDDYVMVRRYLIEYGFLQRTPDGRAYWIPF
jgi:hypothetical protein